MELPRLRQVAFAAADLEAVAGPLRSALRLGEPYHDEGVGLFGLRNAVFCLGDCFLEVVSPVRDGTAAGRYLRRQGGDTGYMVMAQVADAAPLRPRLERLGVRVVWDLAEDDIVDLHLHPQDVPGPLLALDVAVPAASWRWGGPAWTTTAPTHPPGGIRDVTVAVPDPAAAAQRWGAVLDLSATPADAGADLPLPGGSAVRFVEASGRDGLVGVTLALPEPATAHLDLAGVRLDLVTS